MIKEIEHYSTHPSDVFDFGACFLKFMAFLVNIVQFV